MHSFVQRFLLLSGGKVVRRRIRNAVHLQNAAICVARQVHSLMAMWRHGWGVLRKRLCCRLDEIIVFRQLSKSEVKEIADIMLTEVFKRAEIKGIKIDVTERFKVSQQPVTRPLDWQRHGTTFVSVSPSVPSNCLQRFCNSLSDIFFRC